MTIDKIEEHLKKYDLDIRKKENARQFDQKGKTDVITFLAECVLKLIIKNHDKKFSNRDIWESEHFKKKVPFLFNKPKPSNPKAKNEYDKFVSQPILVFHNSGLLKGEKISGEWEFQCNNYELLSYIAYSEWNTLDFLPKYYEKIIKDSGLGRFLNDFKKKKDQQTLDIFRDEFYKLLKKYTPIGNKRAGGTHPGRKEAIRIFNPVLNVICSKYNLPGVTKGHVSKDPITFNDLRYNRINFRDIKKKKNLTRKEAKKLEKKIIGDTKFYENEYRKAKEMITEVYGNSSQFRADYHKCKKTVVHHILPKKDFLRFMAYTENLINLSPTQHDNLAHASTSGRSTKIVNREYQRKLLIANSFYIERIPKGEKPYYSKAQFAEMLRDGLKLDITENTTFDKIREELSKGFFDKKEIQGIKKKLVNLSKKEN